MGPVFISYENHDSSMADELCGYLEGLGHKCWIAPRDIQIGADYAGEITRAIKNSCAFVLICGSLTKESSHVLNEVSLAFSRNELIVPYKLSDASFGDSLEYFLATKHQVLSSGNTEKDFKLISEALESGYNPIPIISADERNHRRKKSFRWLYLLIIPFALGLFWWLSPSRSVDADAELLSIPADTAALTIAIKEAEATSDETVEMTDVSVNRTVDVTASSKPSSLQGESDNESEGDLPAAIPEAIVDTAEDIEDKPIESESLDSVLKRIGSLNQLEGIARHYSLNISTPSETVRSSYLLICSQDGSIKSVITPQDETGKRMNLSTGELIDRINYTKSDIVEYLVP